MLMARLHLALHAPTAIFREVVRAMLATCYQNLVTELSVVHAGIVPGTSSARLGTALLPGFGGRATPLSAPAANRRADGGLPSRGTTRATCDSQSAKRDRMSEAG